MTGEIVVEGFAGPGGNSEGLRLAGFHGLAFGIEWDAAACRTAVGAGHHRVQADVAAFPLGHLRGRVAGVVQSAPCQPWSKAGAQLGLLDQEAVLERVDAFAAGRAPATVSWHDDRSPLSAEPMRYVHALRPRWVMLEQVPAVLPLWRHIAGLLDTMGYSTWCGILHAEEYGVPQTRRRAFLTASLDHQVRRPAPTHQRFRLDGPPQLELLPPPVGMDVALCWTGDGVVISNYGTGGDAEARGERRFTDPSATITSKAGRNKVVQYERRSNGGRRPSPSPSLTILAGHDNGNLRWQIGNESRPISHAEAALLQGFPPGYQWHGTREEQWLQVGNAVPPLLAAAVLRPLITPAAAVAA